MTKFKTTACFSLFSCAAISLCIGSTAHAQTTNNGVIDSITVTAQKRVETLEEVPISIKAFTADEIEGLQIENVADIALLTPSVSLNDGINPIFTSISIRGIGNIGGETSTSGIYLDGFELSANSSAGVGVRYDDIESIEVLRGPQGTTFGRNVVAGAINITTRDVGDEVGGYAEFKAENFGGIGVRGGLDLPIVEDRAGLRIAGYVEGSDGNIENIGSAGGRNNFTRTGARITGQLQLTDRLSIKATGSYDKLDQGLENFIGDQFLDDSLLAITDIIDMGFNPFLEPGSLPAGPDLAFPDQNNLVELNTPTSFDVETFIATANVGYDFDAMEIVWVTGFVQNEINRFEDTDLSEFDAVILDQNVLSEFFSTELRLQSTGNSRLDWTVGLYAAQSEFNSRSSIGAGSEINQIYLIPGGVPLPVGPIFITLPQDLEVFPANIELIRTQFESDERYYAAFAELEFDITDAFSIFGGARFNRDEIKETEIDPVELVSVNDLQSSDFTETRPLTPELLNIQGGLLGTLVQFPATSAGDSQRTAFERVTWRAGLKWRPTDDINLYGIVSTGYRPGGIQFTGGLAPPSFGSESLRNYEVGVKSFLFGRRASINLAGFFMDWRNVQIATQTPGASFSFTDNVGQAEVIGLEFEFLAQPIESLTLGGGLAYLDTEIIEFIDSAGQDRSGNDLPNTAPLSANIFGEYRKEISSDVDLFARASLIYNGEQLAGIVTGGRDRPPLEAFQRVDVRFGVDATENFLIEVYAENLLNDIFATGKSGVGFGLGGQYVVSPPRRIGGRIIKRF